MWRRCPRGPPRGLPEPGLTLHLRARLKRQGSEEGWGPWLPLDCLPYLLHRPPGPMPSSHFLHRPKNRLSLNTSRHLPNLLTTITATWPWPDKVHLPGGPGLGQPAAPAKFPSPPGPISLSYPLTLLRSECFCTLSTGFQSPGVRRPRELRRPVIIILTYSCHGKLSL